MPYFDMSLDELASYDPRLEAPSDLDAFWERTLSETRSHPPRPGDRAAPSRRWR